MRPADAPWPKARQLLPPAAEPDATERLWLPPIGRHGDQTVNIRPYGREFKLRDHHDRERGPSGARFAAQFQCPISVLPESKRLICASCVMGVEGHMKKLIAAVVIAMALAPSGVRAQERTGDAALGALSGAVVLGPVGAVAGAVVGYTAGPAIANSWGLRRGRRHHHRR